MTDPTRQALFEEELLSLVMQAVHVGEIVATLGWARPNRVELINREGIWVATEKSDREGGQSQLVPAWMIAAGWEHLRRHGRLHQQYLVNNLRVNRSAFVCALLARFPNVVVETSPRIGLRLVDDQSQAEVGAAVAEEEATAAAGRTDEPGASVVGREAQAPGHTSRRARSPFSARLNHLFATVHPEDRGPYTSEEVAEALQEDGIPIHGSSISRLRMNAEGPPTDDIVFALAFFFNVEPEYLLAGQVCAPVGADEPAAERKPVTAQRVAERPEDDHPSLKAGLSPQSSETNTIFTTADLLRVIAGLIEVARYYNDRPTADPELVQRMISLISDSGPILRDSLSGSMSAPTHFLEHVVAVWGSTSPQMSGSESEYLWLVEMLDRLLNG